MNLVDLWNVLEAFREHSLNTLEHSSEVPVPRIESLLAAMFFQLNKRLPSASQVDADLSTRTLYSWLLSAYDTWVYSGHIVNPSPRIWQGYIQYWESSPVFWLDIATHDSLRAVNYEKIRLKYIFKHKLIYTTPTHNNVCTAQRRILSKYGPLSIGREI